MRSNVPFRLAAALGAALSLIAAATQARAHAHLVAASPGEKATVSSPKLLTLHFSERLEPSFSGLELEKADGGKVPVTSEVPANDHKAILGKLSGPLAPGAYRVKWHTVSADTHRMEGAYTFTVR
jgi:methionine-rich copper-binding protein CopC